MTTLCKSDFVAKHYFTVKKGAQILHDDLGASDVQQARLIVESMYGKTAADEMTINENSQEKTT